MQQKMLILMYLIASVAFIVGLKMLSHPSTARRGNLIAAGGMVLSIFATIFLYTTNTGEYLGNLVWIFTALTLGSILGFLMAKRVRMTAMPEMVSLFNGMGGACAALISIVEFDHLQHLGLTDQTGTLVIIILGLIIGSVSFSGSMIAWGKLNGSIKDRRFPLQSLTNIVVLAAAALVGTWLVLEPGNAYLIWIVLIVALAYGVLFVMPIGGADMPVVISLLNSFTGVAAACGGFLYDNKVMLTGGILVGAAGTLLTILMCKAMNRSLKNVLLGTFGNNAKSGATQESSSSANYREISISDSAMIMSYAKKVIIVPGYGLAVAQAQHTCHELEKLLTDKGVEVSYAIHPVAGRMPGHMNVLLAEADVSYDKLQEMEVVNDEFKNTDVVLVLGANDVVNPAAKENPASPIYGMPILEVEEAKNIIVNKRSMKPGYAGIENELFFRPKTSMLFGDAKNVIQDLCQEIKNA